MSFASDAFPIAGFAFTGLAVGLAAWCGQSAQLCLLALPVAAGMARRRHHVFALMFGYFGAGSASLPGVVGVFFHGGAAAWMAYGAPTALAFVLALPFLLYAPAARWPWRAAGYLAALATLTVPPVGMLAWMNPLMVAGTLFPGAGGAGVIAAALVFAGLAALPSRVAAGAALLPAILGLVATRFVPAPAALPGFVTINTAAGPGRSAHDESNDTHRIARMIRAALGVPGVRAIVLPESIVSPYRPVDDAILFDAGRQAAHLGVSVVFGAILLQDADGTSWRDAVMGTGTLASNGSPRVIDDPRLLMPVGNWHLGLSGGATPHPFSTDRGVLAGLPIAWSVCYEDTELWSHGFLLFGHPAAMVSMRNDWALRGTFSLRIQTLSAQQLARMAGVPLVVAENT
ncbi:hypothetical protein AB7849_09330 [Rhodanobacter sp. 115]|uniref:hypothetical protein n=1 Tax=Rhodanobacter sp. FW021-MT20 TaxID=1162282 RepID=UPI0034E3D817